MRDHTTPTADDGATSAAGIPDRAARRRRALVSLALAGGLALGGAGIAQAASDAAPSSPSANSSAAPSAPAAPGPASSQDAEGLISAVNVSSLTLTDQGGQERTYTLDDSTTVHQGPGRGQDGSGSLTISDLSVGERIHVRADTAGADDSSGQDSNDQVTAADVDIHPAHIDGMVTDTADGTLTVTDRDGFTRTITTDAETSYGRDGQSSASDITTGTPVRAQGSVASDGTTLQADSVEVATGPAGGPGGPRGPGDHGPGKGGGPGGPAQGGPAAPGPDAPPAPGMSAPSQGDGATSGS